MAAIVIAYHFSLAYRRLLATKGMSIALMLALGLGVGASMTMLTVVDAMTWDPLPGRSNHLFHPILDPLPASYPVRAGRDPRMAMAWPDAQALLKLGPASHQVALASGRLLVDSQMGVPRPFHARGQYATASVFEMFGIALVAGRPWTQGEQERRARVVVLSRSLAARVGLGERQVGNTVRLGGRSFTVIGIAEEWKPRPRFHTDLQQDVFKGSEEFFIPLGLTMDLDLEVTSSLFSWSDAGTGNRLEDPRSSWLQYWVELGDDTRKTAYMRFLEHYVQAQVDVGRFERYVTPRLPSLHEYLNEQQIVPDEVTLQLALCIAFLAVCLLNMSALILARFLGRSHEIAIRRALGARRIDIVGQLLSEAAIIGGCGGLIGLLVAQLGTALVRRQPEDYAALVHLYPGLMMATFVLALVSSLLAALPPALRTLSGRVAMQISVAE